MFDSIIGLHYILENTTVRMHKGSGFGWINKSLGGHIVHAAQFDAARSYRAVWILDFPHRLCIRRGCVAPVRPRDRYWADRTSGREVVQERWDASSLCAQRHRGFHLPGSHKQNVEGFEEVIPEATHPQPRIAVCGLEAVVTNDSWMVNDLQTL